MKNKVVIAYSTNRDDKFKKRYNKELIKSSGLSKKKGQIDVIGYNNQGEFSLTQVYNSAIRGIEAEYSDYIILFLHHDVKFKSQSWGKNLLNIFNNHDVDILGLAGTDNLHSHGTWWLNDKQTMNQVNLWGKVWHTDGRREWATKFSGDKVCQKVQPVAAIDGVFLAIDPDTCLDFDEEFGGFHLYDVSFCVENHLHGKNIAVTETIQLIHESGGQLSIAWEESRSKLARIYERELPIVI